MRPRFRIKFLLLLISAACLVFGWFGAQWRNAYQQRGAVEMLRSIRSEIYYDYEVEFLRDEREYQYVNFEDALSHRHKEAVPGGPAWLRPILGRDFFNSVAEIYYEPSESTRKIAAQDIAMLPHCKHLEVLSLVNANVDDEALRHIGSLKNLRELHLEASLQPGVDLGPLNALRNLEVILLNGNELSTSDVVRLTELRRLKKLDLSNTKCDDQLFGFLSSLEHLERVYLKRTNITEEELRRFVASAPGVTVGHDFAKP